MLYVCPLSAINETVEKNDAKHLITLIDPATEVTRPQQIEPQNHLFLGFNDINAPAEGLISPAQHHMQTLLDYVQGWQMSDPMVIHCWAGVSRSTAAAYITACALRPELDEMRLAAALRHASPIATPNRWLVAMADESLGRGGKMIEAIASIGRGADAFQGKPFHYPFHDI